MITKEMVYRLVNKRKLREHVGCRYFKKYLLVIKGSHSIFYKNYYDWRKVCKEYRDVDGAVRFNDAWRWRKQKAIIRSFHNLIVSFRSYVEYLKEIKKREDINQEIKSFLDKEVDIFEKSHLTCFVILLRNMIVHRQMYPLRSKGIGREEEKSGEIYMHRFQSINRADVEEYINSQGHRPSKEAAKPFLSLQPKDINIEAILDEHFVAVNEIHQKVTYKFISVFRNELVSFRDEVADHLKDFNDNDPINRLQLRYLQFLLHNYERFCHSTSTDKS